MVINTRKKSFDEIPAGDTNMTTPIQRKLRGTIILDQKISTSPQNGLDKVVEEEEDEWDEEDYVDDEEDDEDETDDSNEEEGDGEEVDDDSEEEGENDADNDEYEEDFVDDETEGSEDSQATFLPSALNSDNDSNEEEEVSGNEDETLSLVEELENLGIRSDE
jgi:hypothetical protein